MKKARSTAKTKVTCAYRLVNRAQTRTKDDKYNNVILDDINRENVIEKHKALKASFNNLRVINKCHLCYRQALTRSLFFLFKEYSGEEKIIQGIF